MAKQAVVLGFYGSTLDAGKGKRRWERWRPSVDLCRHPELPIQRFELLHTPGHASGAERVALDIQELSPNTQVNLHALDIPDAWDFEQVFSCLHEFSSRYVFQLRDHRYLIHIATGSHVIQICWFLLTESRHFPAELIQTSPPKGDRSQPGEYRIIDLDLSKYDKLAQRFRHEQQETVAVLKSGINTRNSAFNKLIDNIERVATRSVEPMLLMGPTGAGKSQLAGQIFKLRKARRLLEGEFVEVNCATIRGDGAMSALFGHVRGAFTGAASARPGLLRSADKGLLFLDEIGELGLDEQAMLLRAIEQKRFLPVGTDKEVGSDFQLIAGTNRDLRAAVAAGKFRDDLLARINLWTFTLPSLRERPEDLEPNLEFELQRCSVKLGTKITINREARNHFLSFATSPAGLWKANFRDFGASVLRMATLAPSGRIDLPTVKEELRRLAADWQHSAAHAINSPPSGVSAEYWNSLDRFDQAQLADVLAVCRTSHSLSEAGRLLFAQSRARRSSSNDADRLRKYLAKHELDFRQLSSR